MFKLLTVILLITLIVNFSLADGLKGKGEIGLNAGLSTYWGDIGNSKFKLAYGGSFYYWFSDYFALGVNGGISNVEAEKESRYFQSIVYHISPTLKIKPFPSNKLNLQLLAGFEFMDIDPKGKDGYKLPNFDAGDFERNQNALTTGLAISPFIYDDKLSIDLNAIYHHSMTDYFDGIETGDWKDGFLTATAGFSFYFGKPKDTDGDGIPDKKDVDPLHREDFDGFEDNDGAPDPDNDEDGVLDKYDKAPLDAEDKDGFEDEDGVPDPDNDNDGILDAVDKSPNEAEDKDGFQDEDGAPDLDNDNDGIADVDDKCPNEAETMNDYEDKDGCPDEKPEIAVETGAAIVLDGVNFASGSTKLTPNSKTILLKVVRTMNENAKIEVEIRGYTDNTGNYDGNVRISQGRANSVRDYLVQNGIEGSRIQTKGFGPVDPIAPNDTREGRAKNRRIEFYRVK